MTPIEKAKELIAMGEHYEDAWAKYEEMTNPGDLLPLLRLLVECEEMLAATQHSTFDGWKVSKGGCPCSRCKSVRALLDKLRKGE